MGLCAETYGAAITVNTRIVSETSGTEGIAIQIAVPNAPRYSEGAPVVVSVVGGTVGEGITGTKSRLAEKGFIEITLNFPGSGSGSSKSGGSYDYRGPNCLAALRDVILFAQGKTVDIDEAKLSDLVSPIVPLYTNVGLTGSSNGGNAAISVAGLHGADIQGLAWISNWESPVGDGMPTAEAGAKQALGNTNPSPNPAYNSITGEFDMALLRYSSSVSINHNHTSDIPGDYYGGFYFDINKNGAVDEGTDFILYPFMLKKTTGEVKAMYSERVMQYAYQNGLMPASIPTHLPTLDENHEYWYYRNGEYWLQKAVEHNPNLMFIVTAFVTDHVQTAPDHPHILIQYNGFKNAGAHFARLNPDKSYITQYAGQDYSGAVDNEGFAAIERASVQNALEPDTIPRDTGLGAAACELADRTRAGNATAQLNETIDIATAQTGECATYDSVASTLHIPCLSLTGLAYWLELQLTGDVLQLNSYGSSAVSAASSNCATFNSATNILHVPCFNLNSLSYWIDLELTDAAFSIKKYGQTGNAGFSTQGIGSSTVYASVPGDNGNWVAIRLKFPETGRYTAEGGGTKAPVIVETPTFLTDDGIFHQSLDISSLGAIHVSMIWPGLSDPSTGFSSDGSYDYGGPNCLSALRHVLKFVIGQTTTFDGYRVSDLGGGSGITPLPGNAGIYAFSHPGIPATLVMARYGAELSGISYFVGRENPTQDLLTAVELGHWDPSPPQNSANTFYNYPVDYDSADIDLNGDYAFVKWDDSNSRPYFDNGAGNSYYLGAKTPSMFGKRYYSQRLTQALLDNGALSLDAWPADLATPDEATENWPIRQTTTYYSQIAATAPNLKVMLVFADNDHIQPALDKPHIHQAWDGFRKSAGLSWVRLNPDRTYVESLYGTAVATAPDTYANIEPANWNNMLSYGYPGSMQASATRFPQAAIAEMADRTEYSNWTSNLTDVLH